MSNDEYRIYSYMRYVMHVPCTSKLVVIKMSVVDSYNWLETSEFPITYITLVAKPMAFGSAVIL